MNCPKCGGTHLITTLIGAFVVGKAVPDDYNTATCSCGYRAKASEFGAMFQPMQGTENWTDEQIKQWYQDMREGKIKFHEVIGVSVFNPRALKKIS